MQAAFLCLHFALSCKCRWWMNQTEYRLAWLAPVYTCMFHTGVMKIDIIIIQSLAVKKIWHHSYTCTCQTAKRLSIFSKFSSLLSSLIKISIKYKSFSSRWKIKKNRPLTCKDLFWKPHELDALFWGVLTLCFIQFYAVIEKSPLQLSTDSVPVGKPPFGCESVRQMNKQAKVSSGGWTDRQTLPNILSLHFSVINNDSYHCIISQK